MAAKRSKFAVGAFLIVGTVAYLIYTGIQQTKVYYFTIDELLLQRDVPVPSDVRVAGRVQAGSVAWDPAALDLAFVLAPITENVAADETLRQGVPVSYQGILPDMFAEGRDVIVEGQYTSEPRLVASTIMTSCPSKYEPEAGQPPQES